MEYALITGASRGIGRATALRLANDGMAVVACYHSSQTAALELKQTIEDNGGICELLQFDTSNADEIEHALEQWSTQHPDDYISVLVNNAGMRKDNLMVFMTNEEWDSVNDTVMNGFFYLTRRIVKDMMAHRKGRIINIASLSGLKGLPGQTNYSAAKGAMIGATKALAQEVGPRKITVNAIAPGYIATDMTADLDEKELKKSIPLRRFGTADEVAALVSFLASDQAAYITGEVININGGLYS